MSTGKRIEFISVNKCVTDLVCGDVELRIAHVTCLLMGKKVIIFIHS